MKFRYLLILIALLFPVSCRIIHKISEPVVIHGQLAPMLEYKDAFYVFYDSNLDSQKLQDGLQIGYREWLNLKSNFFPNTKSRISIVMYASAESYNQHAGNLPKSMARFNLKTGRLYIMQEARAVAWRHELVHAMIAEHRHSSYRVQEGLAYYLQDQNYDTVNCMTRSQSPNFGHLIAKLRSQKPPAMQAFFFDHHTNITDIEFAARSAYYMHFLWQKKLLVKSVQYYTRHPSSWFEYEATRADYIRMNALYEEFNAWLKSPAPLETLPGC